MVRGTFTLRTAGCAPSRISRGTSMTHFPCWTDAKIPRPHRSMLCRRFSGPHPRFHATSTSFAATASPNGPFQRSNAR